MSRHEAIIDSPAQANAKRRLYCSGSGEHVMHAASPSHAACRWKHSNKYDAGMPLAAPFLPFLFSCNRPLAEIERKKKRAALSNQWPAGGRHPTEPLPCHHARNVTAITRILFHHPSVQDTNTTACTQRRRDRSIASDVYRRPLRAVLPFSVAPNSTLSGCSHYLRSSG